MPANYELHKGSYYKYDGGPMGECSYSVVQKNAAKLDGNGCLKINNINQQLANEIAEFITLPFAPVIGNSYSFNCSLINKKVVFQGKELGTSCYSNEPDGDIKVYMTSKLYKWQIYYTLSYVRKVPLGSVLPIENVEPYKICPKCNLRKVKNNYKHCYNSYITETN